MDTLTTVGTPNKGQSIFGGNGSNKGIFGIPLFVNFGKVYQIREFSRQIRQKQLFFALLVQNNRLFISLISLLVQFQSNLIKNSAILK